MIQTIITGILSTIIMIVIAIAIILREYKKQGIELQEASFTFRDKKIFKYLREEE